MHNCSLCNENARDTREFRDVCSLVIGKENEELSSLPLAMAYVPIQKWEDTYSLETALQRGTIFPSLDLPFMGRGGKK